MNIAEKAGYIVFKDRKIIIFYANNLFLILIESILCDDSSKAQKAINGLGKLYQ